MSRTLVTGGGGFIGCHVVRELVARGDEVRVLMHPDEPDVALAELPRDRLTLVRGDVLDVAAVAAAMDGCERLYHLAAVYSLRRRDQLRMYSVNVVGTQIVLAEALRRRVARVVHTSSVAAVGTRAGWRLDDVGSLADETTRWNLGDIDDAYVNSKFLSEEVARSFVRLGLDVVIVNPAMPFGEWDLRPTPTGRIVLDQMAMRLPFYFDGVMCAVDVRDVARWHLCAAERGRTGERYILGAQNVTLQDFAARVARHAGLAAPSRRLPVSVALSLATGSEWWGRRDGKLRFGTPEAVRLVTAGMVYNLARTHGDLGPPRHSVDDALATAVAWFRSPRFRDRPRRRPGG
jgi:dihydroflavonol-4-reductase